MNQNGPLVIEKLNLFKLHPGQKHVPDPRGFIDDIA